MNNKNKSQRGISRRQALVGGVSATTLGVLTLGGTAQAQQTTDSDATFNVLDFGAQRVGDLDAPYAGFDSTTAFKAAIAAAESAVNTSKATNGSKGGGVVFVPRGTYRITSTLGISASNIQIVGEGKAVSAIYGHGVSGAIIELKSDNGSQITECSVEGVKFLGTSTPKAAASCISMHGTSKCTLKDVIFSANVSASSLIIEQSWINNFYDLHFTGHSVVSDIYINRSTHSTGSSNALNFFGCNLHAFSTPVGVLIESNALGSSVGEVFQFSGVTCQGYEKGIWVRHGSGVSINSFFGEDNDVHIQLGDNSHGAAFVNNVDITNWRTLRGADAIVLEQVRDVNIGMGYARQVTNTVSVGEATGVVINAGRDIANEIKYAANARTRTGVMVLAGDKHAAPDWPAVPTPMGIILRADSDTKGEHFKITVDGNGNLTTTPFVFGNR